MHRLASQPKYSVTGLQADFGCRSARKYLLDDDCFLRFFQDNAPKPTQSNVGAVSFPEESADEFHNSAESFHATRPARSLHSLWRRRLKVERFPRHFVLGEVKTQPVARQYGVTDDPVQLQSG